MMMDIAQVMLRSIEYGIIQTTLSLPKNEMIRTNHEKVLRIEKKFRLQEMK